jgi:hypothetical protein
MPDLSPLYTLLAHLFPFECMQALFMQQALTGVLLLAPMAAAMAWPFFPTPSAIRPLPVWPWA